MAAEQQQQAACAEGDDVLSACMGQLEQGGASAAMGVANLFRAFCMREVVTVDSFVDRLQSDRCAGRPAWPVHVAAVVVRRELESAPLDLECPQDVRKELGEDAQEWDADCATMVLWAVLAGAKPGDHIDSQLGDVIAAFILRAIGSGFAGKAVDADALFRNAAGRRARRVHHPSWTVSQRLHLVRQRRGIPVTRPGAWLQPPDGCGRELLVDSVRGAHAASLCVAALRCVSGRDAAWLAATASESGEKDAEAAVTALRALSNWVVTLLRPFRDDAAVPDSASLEGPDLAAVVRGVTGALRCGRGNPSLHRTALQTLTYLTEHPRFCAAVAAGLDYRLVVESARADGAGVRTEAWQLLAFVGADPRSAESMLDPASGALAAMKSAMEAPIEDWHSSDGAFALQLLATLVPQHPPPVGAALAADKDLLAVYRRLIVDLSPSRHPAHIVRDACVLLSSVGPLLEEFSDAAGVLDALFRCLAELIKQGEAASKNRRALPELLNQCTSGLAHLLDPEGDGGTGDRAGALLDRIRERHLDVLAALAGAFWRWEIGSAQQTAGLVLIAECAALVDKDVASRMLPYGVLAIGSKMLLPSSLRSAVSLGPACTVMVAALSHADAAVLTTAAEGVMPHLLDAAARSIRDAAPPEDELDPLIHLLRVVTCFTSSGSTAVAVYCWQCCGSTTTMDLPGWLLGGEAQASLGGYRTVAVAPYVMSVLADIAGILPTAADHIVSTGLVATAAKALLRHQQAAAPALRLLQRACYTVPGVAKTLATEEGEAFWRFVMGLASGGGRSDPCVAKLLLGAAVAELEDEGLRDAVRQLAASPDEVREATLAAQRQQDAERVADAEFRATHGPALAARRRRVDGGRMAKRMPSAPASRQTEAERWRRMLEMEDGADTRWSKLVKVLQAAVTITITGYVLWYVFWVD
eukprot:TRINITY_DN6512_c1_g1_i1.p1 TRINITY_DN6512_c1_g1~~TRINITY_DN6512_c1_g1_i1.p1  ORF type:complete len:926 (+),score=286.48 TRINITY_DN6512_c1_g1_i1:227-3004(+)